jgi:RAQPRD family integrative conjugative element protein
MIKRLRTQHLRSVLCGILLITSTLRVGPPVWAEETMTEETHLAALIRQLDTLERLAQQSAEQSVTHNSRYHFDYARLHTDIARIRAGIEDYLSPIRAQPRDPQSLGEQYRADEASAP